MQDDRSKLGESTIVFREILCQGWETGKLQKKRGDSQATPNTNQGHGKGMTSGCLFVKSTFRMYMIDSRQNKARYPRDQLPQT